VRRPLVPESLVGIIHRMVGEHRLVVGEVYLTDVVWPVSHARQFMATVLPLRHTARMTDEEMPADTAAAAETPAENTDEVDEPTRPMQMSEMFDDEE
jgi:hypothetical protein